MPLDASCPPLCRNPHGHPPTPGAFQRRCHHVGTGNGTGGSAYVLDVVHPDGRVEFCAAPLVRPLPDVDVDSVVDLDELTERIHGWLGPVSA